MNNAAYRACLIDRPLAARTGIELPLEPGAALYRIEVQGVGPAQGCHDCAWAVFREGVCVLRRPLNKRWECNRLLHGSYVERLRSRADPEEDTAVAEDCQRGDHAIQCTLGEPHSRWFISLVPCPRHLAEEEVLAMATTSARPSLCDLRTPRTVLDGRPLRHGA